ncbi:MAG: hypothetical protein IJQ16_04745, partial [Selenomonadaceae bacterium]|nr:hypothetical protein [Selenomonadaceae bacterium]
SPERGEYVNEWYNQFWRLAEVSMQINKLSEDEKNFCDKLLNDAKNFDAPARQIYALGLILFGKLKDAKTLFDTKIWSKRLHEDFATYEAWRKIIIGGSNLEGRARLLRDRQIKKFLIEKFSYVIERHAKSVINNKTCPKVAPKDYQIFYGWLQGEENLPLLARCCYNSLKMNAAPYKITFIDEKNYSDYVDIPQYIFEKFKAGKMKPAHFTDIIRINLLERYGGLWLDATILLTEPLDKYKKFLRLPFFSQKFTHEKDNDHPITKGFAAYSSYARWGGFVQGSSVIHNPLYAFMKDFYNEYWREFDEIIDYVLMDFMIDIAYDNIPAVKREIDEVPINNENIWTLSYYLNTPYKNFQYDKILHGNFLNKFSSRKELDLETEGTVLREIQKRYAPETLK